MHAEIPISLHRVPQWSTFPYVRSWRPILTQRKTRFSDLGVARAETGIKGNIVGIDMPENRTPTVHRAFKRCVQAD